MTEPTLRPFAGRRVLLGVSGGIASYKTAWLARLLTKAGAHVDTVLTRSAMEFVSTLTFEALTSLSALAAFPGTLAIYMGMSHLPQIVQDLIKNGKAPTTPAAVSVWPRLVLIEPTAQ